MIKKTMGNNVHSSIQRLMQGASIEAHYSELPLSFGEQKDIINTICTLVPAGTDVYIPHVNSDTLQKAAELSSLFKAKGLNPIPHICARRLSEDELAQGLHNLQKAGVDTALILGGDVCERNAGTLKSARDILTSPWLKDSGFKKLLFGGHPEGNRLKSDQTASDWDILIEKLEIATEYGFQTGVVTQASYNPAAVITWLNEFDHRVQSSPVLSDASNNPSLDIGVVGPASLRDKFAFAAQCQFDTPLDVIRKIGLHQALDFATNARPDNLITELAGSIHADKLNIRFSTLNNIHSTLQNYVQPLQEGRFKTHRNMLGQTYFDIERL